MKKLMTILALSLAVFQLSANPLDEMSLEEKVGQLLVCHFNGTIANNDASFLIQKLHVGGFIYYNWANGLHGPVQVRALSESLQKKAAIPLLIMTDQEGGGVSRLNQGFTPFPGNKALAMTGDPYLATRSALAIGQEMRAAGVNMNLAPVVDVNNNSRNPIIGIRSFGETPEIVVTFARATMEGYEKAGVISCLKHFPGHGDVTLDSHEEVPVVHKTKDELSAIELLPFRQLASKAECIMTAHVMFPALDPYNCATLSKPILDSLRKEIGFEGVILSDSLVMEAIAKQCPSIDEAAVRAFNAGCDLLILGGKKVGDTSGQNELTVVDVQRLHGALVSAVKRGEITQARLNEAVARILALKKRHLQTGHDIERPIDRDGHRALSKQIATLALGITREDLSQLTHFNQRSLAVVAPLSVQKGLEKTSLYKLGKERTISFYKELNPSDEEISAALEKSKEADVLLVFSYNAWKNRQQTVLIQMLIETGKPVILISLRDSLDAFFFRRASLILTTYSPCEPSIDAAINRLIDLLEEPLRGESAP